REGGPRPKEVKFDKYMQLPPGGCRLEPGEWAELTKEDIVRMWAQQSGAAHEDWSHEEAFVKFRADFIRFLGLPPAEIELRNIARLVLKVGRKVVDHCTAELERRATSSLARGSDAPDQKL